MKKVAIVVGHAVGSKGACSPHGIPCEWDFNAKVASYLEDVADVYHYDTYKNGYTSMVRRNAAKLNAKDYILVIELHYNSFSPSANGCEILYYYNSVKGRQAAIRLSAQIAIKFKVSNRGAKAISNRDDRGFEALVQPKAPAILLEPFFGSNKEDVDKFRGKEAVYAQVIRDYINSIS